MSNLTNDTSPRRRSLRQLALNGGSGRKVFSEWALYTQRDLGI